MQEAKKPRTATKIAIGCVSVLLLLYAACVVMVFFGPKPTSPEIKRIGENGFLDNGRNTVFIAVDEQASDELTKAGIAKDQMGLFQLLTSGRIHAIEPRNEGPDYRYQLYSFEDSSDRRTQYRKGRMGPLGVRQEVKRQFLLRFSSYKIHR